MKIIVLIFSVFILVSCYPFKKQPVVSLTPRELELAQARGIDGEDLARWQALPLNKLTPLELDRYLGFIHEFIPNLRQRVQYLARKNLGQPYQIYLLGEFPFEIYDEQPLFCLEKSDCVVFSEHTYAMALAQNWREFFIILQRIRYKNGIIGMLTRNHYTELDWDKNNNWLVEDITDSIASQFAKRDTVIIDKRKFFKRFNIGQELLADTLELSYIPAEYVKDVLQFLQPGDFVNIVRGPENSKDGDKYVGHVGLITRKSDGTVCFLHSTWPQVMEQPLTSVYFPYDEYNGRRKAENDEIRQYNEGIRKKYAGNEQQIKKKIKAVKPLFYGFKFLRLRENPLGTLKSLENENDSLLIRSGVAWPESITINPETEK